MNHLPSTQIPASFRSHFPTLKAIEGESPYLYFDSAATSLKPQAMIDAITHYYTQVSANVHRALHARGEEATLQYEGARDLLQQFIGAGAREEIIFTKGTTEGINFIALGLLPQIMSPGDEIIVSAYDHHSNLVPWQMACEKLGLILKIAPLDHQYQLDLTALKKLITPKTKILSVGLISNVLGTIAPWPELKILAQEHQLMLCYDAAQAIGKMPLDVRELGCDLLVFSGHKMYGPTGVGVLWGKRELLERMKPIYGGGDMIQEVTWQHTSYNELPYKLEAGTPAIASVIGLGASLKFLADYDLSSMQEHEQQLTYQLYSELADIKKIQLLFDPSFAKPGIDKVFGLASFTVDGMHPGDLASYLGRKGVAMRSGHLCAQPLLKHLGQSSLLRASVAGYTSAQDISALIEQLDRAIHFLA